MDSDSRVVSAVSAEALELPALLALLAELTVTDAGRQRAEGLSPYASRGDLDRRRQVVLEAQELLVEAPLLRSFEEPLLPLLETLRRGDATVSGSVLVGIAGVLAATRDARQLIASSELQVPALMARQARVPDAEPLRRKIGRALDRRGGVRDDASPTLEALRRKVRKLRDGLYKDLQRTVTQHEELFSEKTIPLKDGRLVLLLQAGSRGRIKGLVHGRSSTRTKCARPCRWWRPTSIFSVRSICCRPLDVSLQPATGAWWR
jgi:DNA mismatch repair protein MutS2